MYNSRAAAHPLQMLLVFPVSHRDEPLAIDIAQWIAELGPYEGHDALLFFSPRVSQDGRDKIESSFRKCFASVSLRVLPSEVSGWPQGPNAMFKDVCGFIRNHPTLGNSGWYFFEPDNTPMCRGWLDKIALEYAREGKPFCGVKHVTLLVNRRTGQPLPQGFHMVGTGIYPKDVTKYSKLLPFLTDIAWDIFMQWEILAQTPDGSYKHFSPTRGKYPKNARG